MFFNKHSEQQHSRRPRARIDRSSSQQLIMSAVALAHTCLRITPQQLPWWWTKLREWGHRFRRWDLTRGLTATEAGLNYYERARRTIEEADEAELAARGAGKSLAGRLRVAGAVTFMRIHLMPRLPEFLQRHPDLEIEVVLDDRKVDLVQEGIDVALRMGQLVRLQFNSPARRKRAACSCWYPDLFRADW